ncbi:SIR2 family protein [Aerococcus urinaeequi]|uniref:SIR2 family protein n=1 Tax=Aerococcus urinaeequi TaxID=51665 RepID=UPI003AAFB729
MTEYKSYLQDSLDKLNKYIKEVGSRPIFFVGSGISQRYMNTPTWEKLLEILIDENPLIDMPLEYFIQEYDGDFAKVASALVDYYRDYAWTDHKKYDIFPESLFKSVNKSVYLKYAIAIIISRYEKEFKSEDNELKEEINLLRKLNPHAIITTNYDTLMEKFFPKYEPIIGQEIIYQKNSTNIGHILKIHGSIEEVESIVIEENDYIDFYDRQIYLVAKLFTYFMEHPIVFLGYSLNDKNIQSILSNVKKIIDAKKEAFIENIWIIDWSSNPIEPDAVPPRKKSISVGNGESVRINYIQLHNFSKLYKSLYQETIDINYLQQIEETIYNVIKSDSITNLEVDIASLHNLTNSETLLKNLAQPSGSNEIESGKHNLFTFSKVSDPNELAIRFPLKATQLSEKVFKRPNYNWHYAYTLIDKIYNQTGIHLRKSNNRYHINMSGFSRYSNEMVDLLIKVKNNKPYAIKSEDGNNIAVYPNNETNQHY